MSEKLKTCQRCGSLEHTAACGTVVGQVSERDEFEAWAKADGHDIGRYELGDDQYATSLTECLWDAWQAARATPQQAVPVLTEPVAWHIGNPDGTMNKLGAIYHHRQYAVDHFDSYGGDFNASIVPLYAAPQPSQEPEKAEKQKLPRGGGQSFKSVNEAHETAAYPKYQD